MARFDFTPMFRSTIGFDRFPELLTDASNASILGIPRTTSKSSAMIGIASSWPSLACSAEFQLDRSGEILIWLTTSR